MSDFNSFNDMTDCEHEFDCHSSDPHCTKCGINRSEIE